MTFEKAPCLFFAKNACNKGDRCPFSHDAPLARASNSNVICPYYLKGDCRYGNQCINKHSKIGQVMQPLVCKYFLKGECKNGPYCMYRHNRDGPSSSSPPREGSDHQVTRTAPEDSSTVSPVTKSNPSPVWLNSSETEAVPILDDMHSSAEPRAMPDAKISGGDHGSGDIEENESGADNLNVSSTVEQWETRSANPTHSTDISENEDVSGQDSSQTKSPSGLSEHRDTPHPPVTKPASLIYVAPYYDPNVYGRSVPMVQAGHALTTSKLSSNSANTSSSYAAPNQYNPPVNMGWCQKHFVDGYCPAGTSCIFRHTLDREELQKLVQIQTIRDTRNIVFEQVWEEPRVVLPSSGNDRSGKDFNEVCRYWQTNSCKRGNKCLYLHIDPDGSSLSHSVAADADAHGWGDEQGTVYHASSSPEKTETNDFGWGSSDDAVTIYQNDTAEPAEPSEWDQPKAPSAASWGDASIYGSWGDPEPTTSSSTPKYSGSRNGHLDYPGSKGPFGNVRGYSSTSTSRSRGRPKYPRTSFKNHPPSLRAEDQGNRWDSWGTDGVSASANESDSTEPSKEEKQSSTTWDSETASAVGDKISVSHDPQESPSNSGSWENPSTELQTPTESETPSVVSEDPEDGNERGEWGSVEGSWNASTWESTGRESSTHTKTQNCLAFGQGYCPFGDNCRFRHVPQDEDEDEDEDDEHLDGYTLTNDSVEETQLGEEVMSLATTITRQTFNCTVTYGQNASPKLIRTAFQSEAMYLYDIPLSFNEDELASLLSKFGSVLEMQVEFPDKSTSVAVYHAKVTFSCQDEAEEAVKHLHGSSSYVPNAASLRAYLDSKESVMYNWHPVESSPSVKISYPTPSRTAWVSFESMDYFKKGQALNGEILGGRKIRISGGPQRAKKQTHFHLRVEGLPVTIQSPEVQAFFKNSVAVQLTSPTYTDNPGTRLEDLLKTFGELEDLVLSPSLPNEKTRAVAFCRFTDVNAAARAIATLNNTEQAFLGKERLSVQATFYSQYCLPPAKFSILRADIDSLKESHAPGVKFQYFINTEVDGAELQVHGAEPIPFTKARRDVDLLLKGETVLNEEALPLWDDYFDLPSCSRQLEQLNSQNAQSFVIERDFRNRHILVFGSKESRAKAKSLLTKLLAKVQNCVLTTSVSDACMGHMIRAHYADNSTSSDKLQFDFASRCITIRGSVDERDKEFATITRYTEENDEATSTTLDEHFCRLCLAKPSNPISLGCNHTYCRSCLYIWFKSQINPNFSALACIAAEDNLPDAAAGGDEGVVPRCSAPIPFGLVGEILSEEEVEDLLEHSFLSYIWARPEEYHLCPTNDCAMVYQSGSNGTSIRCPSCKKWICSSCDVELHEGLTCSQYTDLTRGLALDT
ncbi:hypothetical protein C8R42DRAFT_690226 [Lentinula raphanica]|nr:hypothetical protein C8R42DRAFT_690226 [Lentinula raphanica]